MPQEHCQSVLPTHKPRLQHSLPWQMQHQAASTSSGLVIPGRRLLTNAHSVENHSQVKVRRAGLETKFLARVINIGNECDLALLEVDSEEFWEGVTEVTFGNLPFLQETVTVIGYPVGGDNLSVTQGVVSRIDMQQYCHSGTSLLAVQIDAAINAGNSGGPVFNGNGVCLGVAFQVLKEQDAENIGYIIPTQVVMHFLTDFERTHRFTGFPTCGFSSQRMENPVLREYCKMKKDQTGVMIKKLAPTRQAAEILKIGDILLEVEGVRVGNDGTVAYRLDERIHFSYIFRQKQCGEKCSLKILRDGAEVDINLLLDPAARLVPLGAEPHGGDSSKSECPSYLIVAGFVFTHLTERYLEREYGAEYMREVPIRLLRHLEKVCKREKHKVVVMSQVLAHTTNVGFEYMRNMQLKRVEGQEVNNLAHVMGILDKCKGDFVRFDLEYDEVIILKASDIPSVTASVLETHGIRSDRSLDLAPPAQ